MCPLGLHPGKHVLDVLWPQRCPRLGRREEQRVHGQTGSLLSAPTELAVFAPSSFFSAAGCNAQCLALAEGGGGVRVAAVSGVRVLEGLFDGEACEGEGADHLEGEEADDIDGVVAGFEVEVRGEVEEFAEVLCGR